MERSRLALAAALFLCLFNTPSSAEKVIFMPVQITSQANIHVEMARVTVDLGHQVWLVLPDTIADMGVLNTTGMSVIRYHTKICLERDIVLDLNFKSFLAEKAIPFSLVRERYLALADEVLSNKKLFQEMKSIEANLFVFDFNALISKMFVVFPYRLEIPFVGVDLFFQSLSRRLAFSPAVVPAFRASHGQHMTLIERLVNTFRVFEELIYSPFHLQDAVARYAPEMPFVSLDRLVARAEVWLIQTDPILFLPYPALPNTKYIGGIAASPPKNPLNPTFQSFMDSAEHGGVIVVSFGSMVDSMPPKIVDKLLAAFLKLRPYKVVFRVDVDSPDLEYVMTSSWLPQNSLLAHPKCRVFVTHCRTSGLYQGLYHGVPMLGLPLFFNQWRNAHLLQLKGFGLMMDIRKASVQQLVDGIRTLLQDPGFASNITWASALYREQYGVPAKTAAYWLDHVMRYGGGYMRSAAQEMPLYQFLLLDVLAVLGGFVFITGAIVRWCVRRRKVKTD